MVKWNLKIIAVLCITLVAAGRGLCEKVTINSPDGDVTANVYVNDKGRLSYTVQRGGKIVIEASSLGISVDGIDLGEGVETGSPRISSINQEFPWRGHKSKVISRGTVVDIPVTHAESGQSWTLQCRAYNDGFAYRYIVDGQGRRKVNGETTTWNLPAGSNVWYQKNVHYYEGAFQQSPVESIGRSDKPQHFAMPITVELGDDTYIAVTEAAVFDYSHTTLVSTGSTILSSAFCDNHQAMWLSPEPYVLKGTSSDNDRGWYAEGAIKSPWRVIITGPDLNALVNNDMVSKVCPAPDSKLFPDGMQTEWIKPGRSLWHWWSSGGVSFEEHKKWIDHAATFGFEYYLIDEGWGKWTKPGNKWTPDSNDKWKMLKELVEYADKHGIGLWVWKSIWDRNNIPGIIEREPRIEFFRKCQQSGVKGIKIDFMCRGSKYMVDFYEAALRDAAKYKLMVNFHGATKPTGESRTYPNEMTREGVKGLEHNIGSKLSRCHYAALAFTRNIVGNNDFTPCTFNPDRIKGTTYSLQLASAIVYTSPVLNWADRPEHYLASPSIAIIKAIPSTWDQTLVLPGSEIGEIAAFARRKGDQWFVGVMNGTDNQRDYEFDLSFLSSGNYRAMLVSDDMNRPDAMVVDRKTVGSKNSISTEMLPGGGFVAWFRKGQ